MKATDNVKFWTFLTTMILAVAVGVLLIDMSIKAAILQESNQLRLLIEGERNDRGTKRPVPNGSSGNGSGTPDVLGKYATGMEAGNVSENDSPKDTQNGRRTRRTPPGNSSAS
jgi:hypothetical protein